MTDNAEKGEAMTEWKVLQISSNDAWKNAGYDLLYWAELGTYESGESYYIYGPTAAQEIGPRYGAGEYLLLDNESERFKRLTVGERQDFYEVKPPEGLSEGDLTAAEVMARDA